MEPIDRLKQLCIEGIKSKGIGKEHIDRLKDELREVIAQSDAEYFLDLFDKKIKYPYNQNNLLITYLLGITDDIDLDKPPESILGEFPDIDCDFIAPVRDYLKNEWAPKTFGEKYVSSIATYGTFKLASTLKDLARLYGNDHNEINLITKKFEATDDEGDPLTFEKALELYDDLRAYCETYPRIKEATTRLLKRSRSTGTHAGGLIISSVPIEDYIPIVRGKEGFPAAAWTEGLNTQDLGPMGFIKYDLLSIADLMRLAYICKIVKQRHGMSTICALEGSEDDWSDTSYLNDPESLAMADRGDTLGIFQFDSFGIRRMMKEMTITAFDDLIVANATYRPGPLGVGMDKTYAKRKKGEEEYEIHPVLKPILDKTYGVLVFQESVMQVLHVVGKIPLKDCEAIRKAISKKKIDKFIKYKEIFIKNGQEVLGQSEEELIKLWSYIEKFSEYGFNATMDISTLVYTNRGAKRIDEFVAGDLVYTINENGDRIETEVVAIHDHGTLPGFEITLEDGYKIVCSINHKFLTEHGQMPLWKILISERSILCDAHKMESINASEEKGWMEGEVRTGVRYSGGSQPSSIKVSGLPEISMEDSGDRRRDGRHQECDSLRFGNDNQQGAGRPPENLRGMRKDQAGEHQGPDGEIEYGQPGSRAEENFLRDGEEDICTTGHSGETSRETEEVAGRKSGRIRKMRRGGVAKSQDISDGDLAQVASGLGHESYFLRGQKATGGSSQGQYLDRGGWLLPLLSTEAQESSGLPGESEGERRSAQCRVPSSWECDSAEIQHGMLCEFYGDHETGMGGLAAGHAPISNTGRLVPRRVIRVVPVGERRMYDLEVACSTHNFILPNGVVTSNSHSTAYAYLAAQLLYLKSHYPLEFYAGTLTSEDDVDKIQEYRLDAKSFGRDIDVFPIDLNKSKDEFVIDGDSIYYSFNDLKGIGKETARKIAQHQPYKDLPDFMERCSTNKDVCTRLIRLGCFGPDVEGNLAYYEKFSKAEKSKKGKVSSFRKSLDNWLNKIFSELKEKEIVEDCERETLLEHFDEYGGCFEGKNADKKYQQHVKSLKKRIEGHEHMLSDDSLPEYCPKEVGELTLADRAKLFSGAEMEYYGFRWIHPVKLAVERAPGRTVPATFKGFESSGKKEMGVDCLIKGVSERTIKNSTRKMYKVKAEDANCSEYVITIWGDDWERFGNFFEIHKDGKESYGNILHMTLQSDPVYGYNLKSYKWKERYKMPKDPADDLRVSLLARGEDWSQW